MNLTTEQIEQILEGAPEGATKCAEYVDIYYFKPALPHGLKLYSPFVDKWQWAHDCSMLRNLRDLSDLREILTLRKRIAELEQRNNELTATVERLRGAIDYCTSYLAENRLNTIGSWSKAYKELQHALESTPPQNLNAVKREVAITSYMKGYVDASQVHEFGCDGASTEKELMEESLPHAEFYASTKYPIGKDGE